MDNSHQAFKDVYVHSLIGDDLLEAGVPFFQLLEALHRVGIHATILNSPAVEASLADFQPLGDLGHRRSCGQLGLRLAQLADYLLRAVSFLYRESFFFCPIRAIGLS